MNSPPETWQQIENIVKCPICCDILDDAKFLDCGHTFCQACIDQCYMHQPSSVHLSCPMCKESFAVSSFVRTRNGLSDLKRNLIAQDVADVVRHGRRSEEHNEEATGGRVTDLPAAKPIEATRRRRRVRPVNVDRPYILHLLRRTCWFLQTIVCCVLVIVIFLSVLPEEDKQQFSTAAAVICSRIHHKSDEKDSTWRITSFFHQMTLNLFRREKAEEKKKPETFSEKVMEFLKQKSKGFCGGVEEYRRRRRAVFRRWMRAMDER